MARQPSRPRRSRRGVRPRSAGCRRRGTRTIPPTTTDRGGVRFRSCRRAAPRTDPGSLRCTRATRRGRSRRESALPARVAVERSGPAVHGGTITGPSMACHQNGRLKKLSGLLTTYDPGDGSASRGDCCGCRRGRFWCVDRCGDPGSLAGFSGAGVGGHLGGCCGRLPSGETRENRPAGGTSARMGGPGCDGWSVRGGPEFVGSGFVSVDRRRLGWACGFRSGARTRGDVVASGVVSRVVRRL